MVAMYHDQGLIPVKYLGVDKGVNVTLGLPLVRTSPDHGTAFDIAGTGRADASSLIEAIRMARQLGRLARPDERPLALPRTGQRVASRREPIFSGCPGFRAAARRLRP